ncbi:PRP38 pre-mRNA processing factor 38 domain-containing protein B [Mortierella polycephala]|uniref:Pre-mRNA-splicing factor 38 n=1 Tax=Mortierella polycephala TaxID=41804 RepID=A0A9P6U0P0_9FUNG|nr:PRP38 pre-mRNA processing factor 38 domain-containing protein B [Mortierella polycephala]
MSSNQLATHGNQRTMNLNSVVFQNIIDSPYLRTLADMLTFQEIVVEAQRNVKSMEPFLKGTTPSTAWVIMYKFWTLPLTIRQLENLIDHPHSVYLRGIGFLYLRYVCKPDQLWDWLGPYLDDDQDIVLQGGVKPVYSTIGKMCYMLLNDQKFLGQILPRIPVMVMRDLEKKLEPYADAGRAKSEKKGRTTEAREGIVTEMTTKVLPDTIATVLDPEIVAVIRVVEEVVVVDVMTRMTIGPHVGAAIAEVEAAIAIVTAKTITAVVVGALLDAELWESRS